MGVLQHPKKAMRKEACWIISNVTAGNREQIQATFECGLFPPLLHLLGNGDFDIKKEAMWAVSNATSGGSHEQIDHLIKLGCIKPIVELLTVNDVKIVGVALEAIHNILKMGQHRQQEHGMPENPCCALIEHADGLSKIEALQEDPNEDVYLKAMDILEKYFDLEEDKADITDDSQEALPQFQFGAQLPQEGFS